MVPFRGRTKLVDMMTYPEVRTPGSIDDKIQEILIVNNIIVSIIASVLLAAPAFGQFVVQQPTASSQAEGRAARNAAQEGLRAKAQKDWDNYRTSPGRTGHDVIASIAASGALPANKTNAASVVQLLESFGARDDRAMLARIAGNLHWALGQAGDTASQRDVQEALARVAKNDKEDPKVRKTAVVAYARMGFFPDSISLIKRAQPVLGDRDFHGELAHMLISAPAEDQLKIIAEMAYGEGHNNGFGKEILANELRNEQAIKLIAPTSVKPLLALLQAQEPPLGSPPELMGLGTIAVYADWLNAMVALNAKLTGELPRYVVARLLKLDGDPRKLVAAFSDEHIAAVVRPAFARRDLDQIDATLAAFAAKYSTNRNVQDFVRWSRNNIAEPATASK